MKTFFITAGAVAQMVEQQNYFSLQANRVPMNPSCVSQVRALSAPQKLRKCLYSRISYFQTLKNLKAKGVPIFFG